MNAFIICLLCLRVGSSHIPGHPQSDDMNIFRKLHRLKRELNDTIIIENDKDVSGEELPTAESLIWIGPRRPPHPGLLSNNPNQDTKLPHSFNSRIPGSSNSNQLISLLNKQNFKLEGDDKNMYSNSRQYHYNHPYNSYSASPSLPDIQSVQQQNYYPPPPPPPLQSLTEAGASILNLLNPMNLLRQFAPSPYPPITNNQLPPSIRQFPNTPNQFPHPNRLPPNSNSINSNLNNLRINPNSLQSNSFRPNQPNWPFSEYEKPGDDPYLENNIGPVKIEYEVPENGNQHEFGFEYEKDSPIRNDVYVGKDGNLYIKGNDKKNINSHFQNNLNVNGRYPLDKDTNSHGRYEEQDVGNYNDYEDDYRQLLKNHNMNEEIPKDLDFEFSDFFSENQNSYDLNSLDYHNDDEYEEEQVTHSNDLQRPIHQEILSLPKEVLNWMQTPHGRVNYPSYHYAPRPVMLPTDHRGRPLRTMYPNNPSYARHLPRPPLNNPLLRNSPNIPHQSNPYQLNPNVLLRSPATKSSRYEDIVKNRATLSPTITESKKASNSHGFYPGNGFFDADFPTMFEMSPSNQKKEKLPYPMYQNGTSLLYMENTTIPIINIES